MPIENNVLTSPPSSRMMPEHNQSQLRYSGEGSGGNMGIEDINECPAVAGAMVEGAASESGQTQGFGATLLGYTNTAHDSLRSMVKTSMDFVTNNYNAAVAITSSTYRSVVRLFLE